MAHCDTLISCALEIFLLTYLQQWQWRRQDLLRRGAKLESGSRGHSRWTSGPGAAAAR